MDYKQRIMEAGTEEFHSKGFNKADMRSIAARASIAVGTIYNYFPDKTSLFRAIAWEHWQKLQTKITTISDSDLSLKEKLYKIGKIHLTFTAEHRAMFREIAVSPLENTMVNSHNGHWNLLTPYLTQLTETIERDSNPKVETAAAQRMATLFFSGLSFLPSFLPEDNEENLQFLVDVILHNRID